MPSFVTGSVWEITARVGERVIAGQTLVILETMKMETPVVAPVTGLVAAVTTTTGALVTAGQALVVLEPSA